MKQSNPGISNISFHWDGRERELRLCAIAWERLELTVIISDQQQHVVLLKRLTVDPGGRFLRFTWKQLANLPPDDHHQVRLLDHAQRTIVYSAMLKKIC